MLACYLTDGTRFVIAFRSQWMIALLVVILTACTEFQSRDNPTFVSDSTDGSGVNDWLSELHGIHVMSPEQLQQMLVYLEMEFRERPSPGNCLRLALLLATGGEQIRDRDRAMSLLNETCAGQYNVSEQELVVILQQLLGELDENSKVIHDMSNQIRKQKQRIGELEQQQRALTDIEQTIQHRENLPGQENDE